MTVDAADLRLVDLREGVEWGHEYDVTAQLIESFTRLFGDRSPLHTDDAFARGRGFEGRVAHGAIVNGFLSHFVGMVLPGRRALLMSADLRYTQPLYMGDRVRLTAKISQRVEAQRTICLLVRFESVLRSVVLARGRVLVRVLSDD